jgi:hypothetical protein
MPLPKEPFKVFISHATTEDGDLVNWIAEALDRLHIRAFVYERYQRGGQNRFEVIKYQIRACPYFLVLLTVDGIASQWVNQEIGYAVGLGKELIPIREVDAYTGKLIESKGFVELHDPIRYYRNDPTGLMASIVYTFQSLLVMQRRWLNLIFLSCRCGADFDVYLNFAKHWDTWQKDKERKPLPLWWVCPKCQQKVWLSFPDCHLFE